MKANTVLNILLIFGGILCFSAVGSYFFSKSIIYDKIHQNIIVQPNSTAFTFWTKPPAKIYRKYYLFDVRNPIEVEKGKDKPFLVERGPYVYSEVWEKRNVMFLGYEFVRYTPVVTLHFEESLSIGSEKDFITFLNVPAMGMIEVASRGSSKEIVPEIVDATLKLYNESLFMTKTVGELISGYEDPLLKIAKKFLPQIVKDDKFSLINGKNGTEWQNYTMMTGFDFASNVAKIISWDDLEKLNYWDSDSANLLNGSDGTFYPPFRTRDQTVYAFNPDMCRSYSLTYLRDNTVKGVKTYDFHLPKDIFYNSTENAANIGFCDSNCLGNGVLNISKCYGGVSGFISQPHFLNADEKFIDSCYGLKPDSNLHEFILHFEPNSGVPIAGEIKLQISFFMSQNDKISLVKNVKPTLVPMFWFSEEYILDDSTITQLKQVALYVNLALIIPIACLSIGSLLILISILTRLFKNTKKIKSSNVNVNTNPDESTRLLPNNE